MNRHGLDGGILHFTGKVALITSADIVGGRRNNRSFLGRTNPPAGLAAHRSSRAQKPRARATAANVQTRVADAFLGTISTGPILAAGGFVDDTAERILERGC
jgi:hypothetical protein